MGRIAIITITRYPRLRWPVVAASALLVGLVGGSRAYLHVHFPSDVLAGWALGLTWPLWLKPLAIGRGFTPSHIRTEELTSDGFDPEALEAEEHHHHAE
jgi:membrane-associated phospholipid phosphatase